MTEKKLRFVRNETPGVVGVCELCDRQFKSTLRDVIAAGQDVEAQFGEHTYKRENISQATSLTVQDAKLKH